jgi:AAA domain
MEGAVTDIPFDPEQDGMPPPSEDFKRQHPDWDKDPLGVWDAGEDDYSIPPRAWLLGAVFCRRFLSSLVADGGTGKTALRLAQLISLAIGRSLTGEHVHRRCRVLVVSLEDDRDELRRRVYAVLRHHRIDPAEVRGWLFLAAPKGLRLAEMKDGEPKAGELERLLRDTIDTRKIDVVSLDPFIKSHGLEENSNNAVDYVCTLLAKLAIELDCAIDLPHHTRKGSAGAGDADRGRGASAMKDAARLVYTLTPMSPEEAERFGIAEAERRSLIRLDSGKVNIAPPSADATWFRLIGVPLGNGAGIYPHGDNVQTVERWQPPDTWGALDAPLLNRILDDLEAGLPRGSRYSAAPKAGDDRAAWRVVVRHAQDKTEAQAREIIRAWLKSGTLYAEDYEDPDQRKTRAGLRVNPTKRPS